MPKDQAILTSPSSFAGFEQPRSNFFRMPTSWTDITAGINNLAELKVVEYILRHTWGFQEYSIKKHITVDEFVGGRKRQNGSRMDRGTGLSERAVRYGIDRAIASGLIAEETDATDPGRIRKSYALRMREDPDMPDNEAVRQEGVHDVHPVHDIPPSGADFAPRSEKETQERNLESRNSKAHASEVKRGTNAIQLARNSAALPYQASQQPVQLDRRTSPIPRQKTSFTPISETIAYAHARLIPLGPTAHLCRRPDVASIDPELATSIREITHEFGDTKHLRANLTQAVNLMSDSSHSVSVFVSQLFEARALTKDRLLTSGGEQGPVRKPMAYFWSVVRDLLQLSDKAHVFTPSPDVAGGPGTSGRGGRWNNSQTGR